MKDMPTDWAQLDSKWQNEWSKSKIFDADPDANRVKCFVTFPFAYMSGPLHVGSGFTAARIDVYARYMRMRGLNVLFPWAWHWTGKTVAGAAERIRSGDEEVIRPIREVDGVSEEHLRKFVDPVYMAQYYTDANREAVKKLGMSIDWRREFHTSSLDAPFSKFVTWQYLRLQERGYVVKGTHAVVWCPKDESPTGDADRLQGEGVRPEEFTLLKFKLGTLNLPCATFRPETIYGVTNLWINPDADYVEAKVNDEHWIISKQASAKLANQLKRVEILRQIKGIDLIGKKCLDPVQRREITILPGTFVNPRNATGLVYSVPAHAPYDWLALRDLQRNSSAIEKFGLNPSEIIAIHPISILSVQGYGEYPAIEIVDRLKIKDQNDPTGEEATKEIYKAEFHSGILKESCGIYSKRKISEIKQSLVTDFKSKGIADVMYELPQPVICRCNTQCVAKVLEDQWFLKYSDPGWKSLAHEAVSRMTFYPDEARNWFEEVIDWLQDWPCARKTGLGTLLPWSQDWIVETLSDSTVYMAYYMVSKFVNAGKIKAEQLTPEIFDHIYYGKGEAEKLAAAVSIDPSTLKQIRREFLYWYPVDLRNSGKDLVGNHLTFFIFHHVALFDQQHWPRAIGVNGFMRVEGQPMHKSKGNFVPLWKACETYGADPVRCTILLAAEGMDDPDWRFENVGDMQNRLAGFIRLVEETKHYQQASNAHMELWLTSRINSRIKIISEAIEKLKTRTALAAAVYDIWNDLRWYQRRVTKPDSITVNKFISIWTRLIAPFAPHLAEETWRISGEHEFVSTTKWPQSDTTKIDENAEEREELVKQILEDTQEIISTTKLTPQTIHYYTAAEWKWRIYQEALQRADTQPETLNGLIRDMITAKNLHQKDLPKFASKIITQARTMPVDLRKRRIRIGKLDERNLLLNTQEFLSQELKVKIVVHDEDEPELYDPKSKAKSAEPYRPGIFIE